MALYEALRGKGSLITLDLGMRRTATVSLPPGNSPAIALRADGKGGAEIVHADASLAGLDGNPLAAAPTDEFAARAGSKEECDEWR